MVKIFYGSNGSGKTKVMVDTANNLSHSGSGNIVYIDSDGSRIYDLHHKVRFIDTSQFHIIGYQMLSGFICGIISEDYDIEAIFIDGLAQIINDTSSNNQNFFKFLETLSVKYKLEFFISINGDEKTIPDYLKEYIA